MQTRFCTALMAITFLNASCTKVLPLNGSQTNWVKAPEWISSRVVANKKIPVLDKMGLRYQITLRTRAGHVSNTDRIGPFASNDFVNVDIFQVSQLDCESLRTHFSSGRSHVLCSQSPQDYSISDFLDPAIQAAVNSIEQRQEDAQPNKPLDLPVSGENCWALAYEIARLAQAKSLDFRTWDGTSESGGQLWNMFANDGFAKQIADSPQMVEWGSKVAAHWDSIAADIKNAPPINDKLNRPGFIFGVLEKYAGKMPDPSDNENLLPGDVLLVGQGEDVAHAAIFVAPGLYFERTQGNTIDWGGGNRLVLSDEIVRMYAMGGYSHWRVTRNLPLPENAFHDTNGQPVSSKQHEILFNQHGIAHYAGALTRPQ